jgi:hypothetical protein
MGRLGFNGEVADGGDRSRDILGFTRRLAAALAIKHTQ